MSANLPACHQDSPQHAAYVARVEELEAEGCDTSDAQGIADMEFSRLLTQPKKTTKPTHKMKITDINEIKSANSKFKPDADGAYATCRSLPGQYAQENQQEWAERGTIDGKAAKVFYLFENSEAEVEDGADMPFDADHITHIEIEEEA